ncbi:hypothetical protein AAC387_Pa05g1301 [Persea americana]
MSYTDILGRTHVMSRGDPNILKGGIGPSSPRSRTSKIPSQSPSPSFSTFPKPERINQTPFSRPSLAFFPDPDQAQAGEGQSGFVTVSASHRGFMLRTY